jgi:hypothetical protein
MRSAFAPSRLCVAKPLNMKNAKPPGPDPGRGTGHKRGRAIVIWGVASLTVAGVLTFYVVEAVRLSHYLGGFSRMEAARPTGYPGLRCFIAICGACMALTLYCASQFFRAMRHENNP